MTDFKKFKDNIKQCGDVWKSEHVYFMQTRDYYIASYMPYYPQTSKYDKSIYYDVWSN